MPALKRGDLTLPDLIVLRLLAEKPMHGYEANFEIERRQISDWASISRPTIYWSIQKLLRYGVIREKITRDSTTRRKRRVFVPTPSSKAAVIRALGYKYWAMQRSTPEFVTWVALSSPADKQLFRKQIRRREKFLEAQIARENCKIQAMRKKRADCFLEADWVARLTAAQLRTELRWLHELCRQSGSRRSNRRCAYGPIGC
jgi:DNA-binding PadR family transcriptional regulator